MLRFRLEPEDLASSRIKQHSEKTKFDLVEEGPARFPEK
jgi:hypothetical protein